MPKQNKRCTCLSVILLDSTVVLDNKYHPEIFLKQCKYAVKNKKIIDSIIEDANLDYSDSDQSDEK